MKGCCRTERENKRCTDIFKEEPVFMALIQEEEGAGGGGSVFLSDSVNFQRFEITTNGTLGGQRSFLWFDISLFVPHVCPGLVFFNLFGGGNASFGVSFCGSCDKGGRKDQLWKSSEALKKGVKFCLCSCWTLRRVRVSSHR